MIDLKDIMELQPYSLKKTEKEKFLTEYLKRLTEYHAKNCKEYQAVLKVMQYNSENIRSYYELPFLPVRLFKEYSLVSGKNDYIIKTMTSSGTTGQNVSRIYLDRDTSLLQAKALSKIVGDFIGSKRFPMIIIDSSGTVKKGTDFSARSAGIRGFSIFGRDVIYALDDEMELNILKLREFLDKHKGETILLFGFTFMIWQHFYKKLKALDIKLDLSNAVLIHGGGWKKLTELKISSEEFKRALFEVCTISHIHDYYGMVEQTGCIYMECEYGHLHASNFSDVIIRKTEDFSAASFGEQGMIEVVSVLPHSYPGHILLTEDEGVILGEDDCPCGRKGKYIKVTGRIKNAELRGCSDTYADRF